MKLSVYALENLEMHTVVYTIEHCNCNDMYYAHFSNRLVYMGPGLLSNYYITMVKKIQHHKRNHSLCTNSTCIIMLYLSFPLYLSSDETSNYWH